MNAMLSTQVHTIHNSHCSDCTPTTTITINRTIVAATNAQNNNNNYLSSNVDSFLFSFHFKMNYYLFLLENVHKFPHCIETNSTELPNMLSAVYLMFTHTP